MANANTPLNTDNNTLSSATDTASAGASEAIVSATENFNKSADAAGNHPIRDQVSATYGTIKDEAMKRASSLKDDAAGLKDQAGTKAREACEKGKGKAAEAVGSLAKLLEDTAGTVDEKFGKQYGDYARSAATSVSGFATAIDQKELDELAGSARDFVKKSPAVAVGAAAVAGFVLARLLKGSSSKD